MAERNVHNEDISGEIFVDYSISELIQLLRSKHEFRQNNRRNIAKFRDDAENNTVKKMNELLRLSDGEIVWELTGKTHLDFIKEMGEMCAYINETIDAEKRWDGKSYEKKLALLTPVELEELAQKMARAEMEKRATNSLTGKFSFRARRFLVNRNVGEEKELARNIRDDLLAIVESQIQIRREERINATANVENSGQSLDILTETARRQKVDSPQEATQSKQDKTRTEQARDER